MEILNGDSTAEKVRQNQNNRKDYIYLNEALFRIKDPNYISPYQSYSPTDYKPFSNDEINNIYNALQPTYKALADMQGDPKEEWKYNQASVMFANVFGTSFKEAREKVQLYYPLIAERNFNDKGYGSALWNSVKSAFYSEQLGYATSLYMATKNEIFKKQADNLYEEMMKARSWQSYGLAGDFLINNMQGLYSMAQMGLITATTGGLGTAFGMGAKALKWTSWGINTALSGMSQQGMNTYLLSRETDDEGNPLFDFDNVTPLEQLSFWGSALAMGVIETSLDEIFSPLPKAIRNHFGSSIALDAVKGAVVKTGFKKLLSSYGGQVIGNIIGEASEEILQQLVGNIYENAQKKIKNEQGSNFEPTPLSKDLWSSFVGGLEGSVLASVLSCGFASVLNSKTAKRIQTQTRQTQNFTEKSETIYNEFVNDEGFDFTKEEVKAKAEEMKTKKADPINIYGEKGYFGFYTDRDGALTLQASKLLGNQAIESQLVENVNHNLETFKKKSAFAKRFGGTLNENTILFESQQALNSALETMQKERGMALSEDKNTLTVETSQGKQDFNLKVGSLENEKTTQAQTSKENNKKISEFIKGNNLAKTEKEEQGLNSFLNKIYDITKKGKNASVDNFLSSIEFISDDNIKGTSKGSIEILQADQNGYKKGIIHLDKNSTFETITHELNHYIQNNASIEDLRGFEKAYNINLNDRESWNKQVSQDIKKKRGIKTDNYTYAELFANDAEKYYKYGTAQNSQMKSFFQKMKNALKGLYNFLRAKKINKETLQAFDRLFQNSTETPLNESTINETAEGGTTYYDTAEDGTDYDFTDSNTIKELKEKDYILPPRDEVFKNDAETESLYRQIEVQKATGNDLIKQARDIRENYELLTDKEDDINGIFTDEDRKKLNQARELAEDNESIDLNVDKELYNIFAEKVRNEIGKIDEKVLEFAWKLSNIQTDKQADLSFIYNYASSYEGLLDFINTINSVNVKREGGTLTYDYNDFGIREDFLNLKKNSPKALFKEMMTAIRKDPRAYRIAFEDALDVKKGREAIQKRAYNRMINNEMLSYLGLENIQEEELSENEIKDFLKEDISNFKNIANLKAVPKELRESLRNTANEIQKETKELERLQKEERKENAKKIKEQEKLIENLNKKNEKLKEKLANYIEKTEIGNQLKRINKLSKPSDKTHSYKANSSFLWLRLKFLDEVNSTAYTNDLNQLNLINEIGDTDYSLNNPPSFASYLLELHNLQDKETLETLEDYKELNSLFRDLRKVARAQLEADTNERREQIFETRKKAYNEEFGEKGAYSKGEDFTLSFYDDKAVAELNKRINEIEDINEKKDFKATLKKGLDKLYLSTAHPFQIMQSIDKTKGGTWQDIHTSLKESEFAMQKSLNERFDNLSGKIKEVLGFDDKKKIDNYLLAKTNEDGKEFFVQRRKGEGTERKSLTRNEALMIYAYSIQEEGMQKLINSLGNNFTEESIDNLVNNLISDKDKAFTKILSDDLSSKWKQIARVFARQNNKIMPKTQSYFPLFASQNSFSQSVNTDMSGNNLRTTIHNDSRYANKSMTHERTNLMYSLKLDLWNNFLRGVQTQEKYIHQSDWIRDAQYWISPRGMGTTLSRSKGKLWTNTVKNFINDIAEPQAKANELNGFMSTVFSNMSVANLMFNTVSALKQFGAVGAVLTDPNFRFGSFCKAIADLTFRHRETTEAIREANPFIASQKGGGIDLNENLEESSKKRKLNTFKEWGLKMADITDLQGRYIVWQSAFQSYIDKFSNGNLDSDIIEKAKASANRVIEETQNNTKRSELSSLQSKISFFGGEKLAYSNSTFLYLNKFYEALHLAKNKDYKQFTKHLAMLLVNGAFMTLLSGVFFKPKKEDEDELDRIREGILETISNTGEGFVPLWGELTKGFGKNSFGNSSVYDVSAIPKNVIRVIKDFKENKDTTTKNKDMINLMGEIGKPTVAMPSIMLNRLVKGVTDEDSTSLDKKAINTLINLILGTGFYNNIKGR